MRIGDPFVYFLIVALVAPVVWMIWWAVDSAFSGTRVAAVAPATPKTPKPTSEDYPRPVDITLPRRRGAIAIYSLTDRAEIDSCRGADAGGRCPRPLADGTVACAGCLLALPASIRGSAEWQVPSGYKYCPVASYEVYRQQAS